MPNDSAAAFATARDTPNIAFAPKFDLFGVSSNFIIVSSIFFCSYTFIPIISFDIFLFTFSTDFWTPFPLYLFLSPSLNSTASKLPVDAPDGTDATPINPPSVLTSTWTVGFPLESKISKAFTFSIAKNSFIFYSQPPLFFIFYFISCFFAFFYCLWLFVYEITIFIYVLLGTFPFGHFCPFWDTSIKAKKSRCWYSTPWLRNQFLSINFFA